MVSSLTRNTYGYLVSHHFVVSSGRVGGLLLGLLVLLLIEKEVLRAVVRSLPQNTRRVFDVVAIPLLLTFAIVVIERFRALGF
jgi:fructose-specific phosphotransferase system IIC component